MKKNFAYNTYKDVELLKNFRTKQELHSYRKLLMDRLYKREIPFFKKEFPSGFGDTLEVGSGNSRILYALEKEHLIRSGLGVEISPSRVAFAEAWKKDLNSRHVNTVCGDILSMKLEGKFDAVLCLTSIFPFFDVLTKNGINLFLATAYKYLKPGGLLILESETFYREIECCKIFDGKIKLWDEFNINDPFQFNLVEYDFDTKKRELTATTYNTKRHKLFVDGPTIKKWHMEEAKIIKNKLHYAGFTAIKTYSDYDSSPYSLSSPRYIFIAKKPLK